MTTGLGFIDILVSEAAMVAAALLFFLCGALLIFKRRSLRSYQKGLAAAALIVTGLYLAFIVWLVIMWG